MKKVFLILIIFSVLNSYGYGQNKKNAFDGPSWKAPYILSLDGWGVERFLLPPSFAPKIGYTGVEDLRFSIGWGDSKSEEYWSYAYLWYLDGNVETNSESIQTNLALYYDGLIDSNIEIRKISPEVLFPTEVVVNKIQTLPGDLSTFTGTIKMLDYMKAEPITLNYIIHQKSCAGQAKSIIFFEISPKPMTDKIWNRLNNLWQDFKCD